MVDEASGMKSLMKRIAVRPRRHDRAAKQTDSIDRSARDQGDRARDRGDWVEAARLYRKYLSVDRLDAAIWIQLGHALKEAGQIRNARQAYDEAVAVESESADAHLHLGHALKLQGLLCEAALSYGTALALDPGSAAAAIEVEDSRAGDVAPCEPHAVDPAVRKVLARQDLLPALVARFDAEFYTNTRQLGREFTDSKNLKALTHFCEVGLNEGAAIADGLTFDPAFYREAYGGGFPMSDVDAYRRWLNHGLAAGQAPNRVAWLQDVQDIDLQNLDSVDLDYYRMAKTELLGKSTIEVIVHLLDGGLIDDDVAIEPTSANAELFVETARRMSRRGQDDRAIRVLERLLHFQPDHPGALSDYGDRLFDLKRFLPAMVVYRRLIDAGRGTLWTYNLLGQGLRAQRDWKEALRVAARGVAAFPQHDIMRRERRQTLELYYQTCEMRYWHLARLGRVREGQAAIDGYCRTAAAMLTVERLPRRPVRSVALFGSLDLPQCRFYRIDQKVEQLEHAGLEVRVFDARTDAANFLAVIARFEAVIFYRVALYPHLLPIFEAAQSLGLTTFYEIDDLVFQREDYPDSLESYGGQITRDQHVSLSLGPPLFVGAMSLCDYAIASTPTLATEMARYVAKGRAFVHRNALSADHLRYVDHAVPTSRDRPVTIFYGSGTRAHKEDFTDLIEPALVDNARRHGDRIAIVLVGWLPISDALREAAPGLIVVEPVFDIHRYWDMLKEADINLAVLKPSLAVDCKSEIKWMEAAIFGIPSIVSRTATYAEVVRDGETGMLCDTVADWTGAIDRLVDDPSLRRAIGTAARDVVHAAYSLEAMSANLAGIFREAGPRDVPKPRQKILFVNVFYAPQLIGGATRVLHDNISRLSTVYGDEFDCEVFTCVDGKVDDYVVESYVQEGVRVTSVSRSSAGESVVDDPRMGDIFRDHIEASRPDLIHFHCVQRLSVAVVNVALARDIPYVLTAHDAWWISGNQFVVDQHGREEVYDANPLQTLARHGRAAFARAQLLRPALFGARHVLAVSRPFGALYERCGVPNVETIANGVSALASRPRLPAPDRRVRLGFVGGLSRHKGYRLLKAALMSEAFDNLSLTVVDHSRSRDFSRRETWGTVPVEVVGKYDPGVVVDLYGRIDVLMAPSVWPESFGLVTREARHCGCWVVASDRGDIGGDVVDGVNGHIVDVADAAGLVAALRLIDRDGERYRRPPPDVGRLRSADDQADDLVALYRRLRKAAGPTLDGEQETGESSTLPPSARAAAVPVP